MTTHDFEPHVDSTPGNEILLSTVVAQTADLDGLDMRYSGSIEDIAHNNALRARFAALAATAYAEQTGEVETADTVIGDLMGDLMHLCDALGLDIDEMIERARLVHADEVTSG